ncbi:MAG: peptidase dimerization domain-containing protein, partial [Halobacteriales archaeon]
PTVINTGEKVNVIPASVELTMDCRLIPGQTDEDIERELRAIIPDEIDVELEPLYYNEFPAETDTGLFDLLGGVLEDADPEGKAIPYMLSGATDGRHLARIGIQSYGYTPMKLPEAFDLLDLAHAADERIPTEAVEFGADAIEDVVTRYDGS